MKNKEKIIGSIVILCLSIIFIIVGYSVSKPKENVNSTDYTDVFTDVAKPIEKKDAEAVISSGSDTTAKSKIIIEDINIKVDIKGAIKNPGVYEIKKGSRVTDLIKLAGGGTPAADLDSTNLSSKLNDEDCIVINTKGEANKLQTVQSPTNNSVSSSSDSSSNSKEGNAIININTASKEELMTLTGIGDVKADVIIEYRKTNGGFKSVQELTKVGGIGEKTLSKFIDKIDIK
ncbi:MAG TPA: helix-hairpin-helix domain-containing protein [Clostridium sp.]|uniref:helix-hairpin-helix domain-containing protein n=1 Tax=Clostridium sp. TaxID=1506 RepID=UPI002F945716